MELTRIEAGDVVVVTGPESIGLLALQVAKAQGGTVIVGGTNIDQERLAMAKRLGADRTVDVTNEDIFAIINELTGGRGADVLLECSRRAEGGGRGTASPPAGPVATPRSVYCESRGKSISKKSASANSR